MNAAMLEILDASSRVAADTAATIVPEAPGGSMKAGIVGILSIYLIAAVISVLVALMIRGLTWSLKRLGIGDK